MVREDPDNIRMLGVEVKEGRPFLPSEKTWWIKEEDKDKLKTIGVSYYTHSKVDFFKSFFGSWQDMLLILSACRRLEYLLDKMEDRAPDLVHEVSRLLPLQKIADLFKRLVQEQISIRDLRSILEAIIIWAPKEKDQVMLCEYIRSCLKRQISYKYCAGQNILPAIFIRAVCRKN